MRYTITTTKGVLTADSLAEIVSWQREIQGAFAEVSDSTTGATVSIDDVDVDADGAEASIRAMLAEER